MTYDYHCKECDHSFEKCLLSDERNAPLADPCPSCGQNGTLERLIAQPIVSSLGKPVSVRRQAGNAFNDLLKKIHKGAGRKSTIETL